MADDVHVDARPRAADHLADHGAPGQALPARAAARAHHDLGHVQCPRGVEERIADVFADDFVVAAAELVDQVALALEKLGGGRRETVLRDHVHSDELAVHAVRHPRRPPDEPLAVGRPGQRDEHPLAGLPRLLDPVALSVLLEALVHTVREPGQRELAQRGEVPRPEVVREGGIDPLRRVDVAAPEPVAERGRRQIDELELVGAAHDVVGDRLALLDACDFLDDVVQRLQVLDVQRRDDRDAGVEQLLDVLPALLVPRARRIRVRELVDEGDLGLPREDRVDVHLLERRPAVLDRLARDDLEVADLRRGLRPAVRLDVADDDVFAVLAAAPSLVEHGVRLPDACRGAEVDPKLASGHGEKATPARAPG